MKKIIFLSLMLLVFSSCARKIIRITETTHQIDTLKVTTTIYQKDTTIPKSEATQIFKIDCDSFLKARVTLVQSSKDNNRIKQSFNFDNQMLSVLTSCEEIKIKYENALKEIERISKTTVKTATVIEKGKGFFFKLWHSGSIVIAILMGITIQRIFKF
jgi:hypothetical protein